MKLWCIYCTGVIETEVIEHIENPTKQSKKINGYKITNGKGA